MFSGWPIIEGTDRESSDAVYGWLVRLRWIALLGVALVLLLAGPVLSMLPAGVAGGLWATAAALAAYNAMLVVMGPRRDRLWLTHFAVQITVDCVALATFVHLAGGPENPFLPLFVLHVVTAGIVMSSRGALFTLGLAIAIVSTIILGEGSGLIPHHCLRGPGAACSTGILDLRAIAQLGGLVLSLVGASLFTRFLAARLRAGQRRLLSTVTELTAERQRLADTRAAIETERSRLQAIIDCMDDAVTFLGPGGIPLFSNRKARDLWRNGAPPGGYESRGVLPHNGGARAASRARTSFEQGGRAFDAIRSPVRGAKGANLGTVLVVRDVTDRLAMDKRHMHEERMNVVGKLAATIAHEINNPIGVLCLYSQHALAHLSRDNPVYKNLETIRRNAEDCRTIIGNLLKLARSPKPERRRVDLRRLCREVVEFVEPLALRHGIAISGGIHASDVPIWAQADASMLHQALLNLAVNAIEAGGAGDEVSIGAYETQDGLSPAQAIEVRDTGAGIAAGDLERIFQPFFTTKQTGTGLGLSVADNIVKGHDGRIDVENAPGRGTVFRIVLPDPARDDMPPDPPRLGGETFFAAGRA
ncbi:hypothetical protein K8I61_20410 [bacterium]|nr:hypothetical protein [bacterium]